MDAKIALICSLVVISMTGVIFGLTSAQESDRVYAPDSKPFGLSYGQWSEKWWQWSLGISLADNPGGDETGEKCAQAQNNTHVWYLAGTFGGQVTRNCAIPSDKAVLFPIINNECSYLEYPAYKTEAELRKCATTIVDKVQNLKASVDGVNIPDLKKYRFESSLYNFTTPIDNVLGLAAGTTDSVADGYWIIITPLSKGTHTVEFGGSIVDVSTTSSTNFATDVIYHITVQ